jgi:hypothetical protein
MLSTSLRRGLRQPRDSSRAIVSSGTGGAAGGVDGWLEGGGTEDMRPVVIGAIRRYQ